MKDLRSQSGIQTIFLDEECCLGLIGRQGTHYSAGVGFCGGIHPNYSAENQAGEAVAPETNYVFLVLRSTSARLSAALSSPTDSNGNVQPLRQCQCNCLEACAKGARVIEMACGTGKTRVMQELVSNVSGRVPWAGLVVDILLSSLICFPLLFLAMFRIC